MVKKREGETLEEYKARRRAAKAEEKAAARRGWWVHKVGETRQPYGELPSFKAAQSYTRRAHEAAAVERIGKQMLLEWIAQFLRTPEVV